MNLAWCLRFSKGKFWIEFRILRSDGQATPVGGGGRGGKKEREKKKRGEGKGFRLPGTLFFSFHPPYEKQQIF